MMPALTEDARQHVHWVLLSPPSSALRLLRPQATLTALSTTLMTLSSLYNDVAHPLHLWDLCLRILDASELPEAHAEVALALWTNLLVHPGSEEAAGEQEGAQWVGLQEATETVVGVGRALRLGGPALPLAFIARQVTRAMGALCRYAGRLAAGQ